MAGIRVHDVGGSFFGVEQPPRAARFRDLYLPNEVQLSCLFSTVAFCVIVILFLASLTSIAKLVGMCLAGTADSN